MVIKHKVLLFGLLLFTCAAGLALLLFYQRSTNALSPPSSSKPIVKQSAESKSFPIRIKIPKIQVDASIENVGVTQSGAMDVPQNIMHVGWYKFGSVPGNIGSAVMDGHVDGKNGEAGIFALLHMLNPGDKIYIVDNKGKSTSFIVSKTHLFNPQDDTSVIFNQNTGIHLNLITCFGIWDKSKQSYSKRFVIFANISH